MTFAEFAHLEPGSVVLYFGAKVVYVGAVRFHPMAAKLSGLTGLPISPPKPGSVMSRLRDAYVQVVVPMGASHSNYRSMTDDEILADESVSEPYGYYRAKIQWPGSKPIVVSAEELWIEGPGIG